MHEGLWGEDVGDEEVAAGVERGQEVALELLGGFAVGYRGSFEDVRVGVVLEAHVDIL